MVSSKDLPSPFESNLLPAELERSVYVLLTPIALTTAEFIKYVAYVSGGYGPLDSSQTSYTSKSPDSEMGPLMSL
jgi:hypothetical protein